MKFGEFVKEVEVGKLYTADLGGYRGGFGRSDDTTKERWHKKPVLYLGENIIEREDGVVITNHKFLVGGTVTLADKTFVQFLREIDNDQQAAKRTQRSFCSRNR